MITKSKSQLHHSISQETNLRILLTFSFLFPSQQMSLLDFQLISSSFHQISWLLHLHSTTFPKQASKPTGCLHWEIPSLRTGPTLPGPKRRFLFASWEISPVGLVGDWLADWLAGCFGIWADLIAHWLGVGLRTRWRVLFICLWMDLGYWCVLFCCRFLYGVIGDVSLSTCLEEVWYCDNGEKHVLWSVKQVRYVGILSEMAPHRYVVSYRIVPLRCLYSYTTIQLAASTRRRPLPPNIHASQLFIQPIQTLFLTHVLTNVVIYIPKLAKTSFLSFATEVYG